LSFASAPISRAIESYALASVRESYREDAVCHLAQAKVAIFLTAVFQVAVNETVRVGKSKLGYLKANPVLSHIFKILIFVPLKRIGHQRVYQNFN
jgi:hypothetical protein